MKRIALTLSFLWLVLAAIPAVPVSARGRIPANHTRAVAAARCDVKKCDNKCEKACGKKCDKQGDDACRARHQEKK